MRPPALALSDNGRDAPPGRPLRRPNPSGSHDRQWEESMRRALSIAALASMALLATPAPEAAAQEKKVRLNMGGAFPSSMAMLGPAQLYFADRVKKISGGTLEFKFFEPGALVPASQYFDAVSAGNLDSAFTGLGFFTGKEVALALFSSVPFGPEMGEYLGWMRYGGGDQLMQELTRKYNIESMLCSTIAPEATPSGRCWRVDRDLPDRAAHFHPDPGTLRLLRSPG